MATRKFRKSKPRKTVRRHRTSTSGKVKVPLDVRSDSDLPKFRKCLKDKDVTFIMVYATWCQHCHTMMPHFDAAAKSPNNTVSAVKINETMLDKVNNYIKNNVNRSAKPLNVEGYPSIILVNKNAEKLTDIEPIRDTEALTKVMENAGPLAKEASLNNNASNVNRNNDPKNVVNSIVENELVTVPVKNNNKALLKNLGLENKGMVNGSGASPRNIDMGEDELKGSIASENEPKNNIKLNSVKMNNVNKAKNNKNKFNLKEAIAPSPLNSFPADNETTNVKAPSANLKKEAEEIISLQAPLTSKNLTTANIPIKPINPPSLESNSDMVHELEPAEKLSGGSYSGSYSGGYNRNRHGGSLMSAMARTSYALAPAAALLATAAIVMKGKKTRKHSKKSRKTHRRRR
jgi:thiol-disulfide isomerase/thioredoxin